MAQAAHTVASAAVESCDPIWSALRDEARAAVDREPAMAAFFHAQVLRHETLETAVCQRVSQRLTDADLDPVLMNETFREIIAAHRYLGDMFRADLSAVFDRDPACTRYLEPLLYFKGFHALCTHRFANALWRDGRRDLALLLQSASSRTFNTDINPAAQIGMGLMLDHASGIVVGETAVIGNNCSILQGVTLGGTGKESGDRHPKIGDNVLIGAGANVLGNIKIGDCSLVAAGSVVLDAVPPNTTVAGVPARVVGPASCPEPARSMNQGLGFVDESSGI
ncbi:MAG: serine O-acetyltransferase [Pseudomonadota bacterium]